MTPPAAGFTPLPLSRSALCNDSSLSYQASTGSYTRIGESTELALRVFVEKVGLNVSLVLRYTAHCTSTCIACSSESVQMLLQLHTSFLYAKRLAAVLPSNE